jgi:hypothetical protein
VASWRALADEAARWRDAGRTAQLWWRDDDAVAHTQALDRLLDLRRDVAVPLALAVVPAPATRGLAGRLAGEAGIDVLQHGYAHVNHAPAGEKKAELGAHRPARLVLGELGTGWVALEGLLGRSVLPVLVPPWNRIAPGLVPALPEIGFRGLSTFGPRRRVRLGALREVNAHVDLLDWKHGRGFVGEAPALAVLLAALQAAREVSPEPVGVLSHHLAMDAKAWDFLRSMWEKVQMLPGLAMRPAHELFAGAASAPGEGGA